MLFVCFSIFNNQAYTQHTLPKIKNYTKADYSGYLQNWSIDQTEDGRIVVGNQAGLMIFNGVSWSLHTLPNETTIRSVHCIGNLIYIGSYEEFGYFHENENSQLIYQSLSETIKEEEFHNDEFWSILPHGDVVYFQSFTDIYEYNKKTQSVKRLRTSFVPSEIEIIDGQLIVFGVNKGGFRYQNGEFISIRTPKKLQNQSIAIAKDSMDNQSIVCSQSFDCYLWSNNQFTEFPLPDHSFFDENQLNVIKWLPSGDIFFGSIQKGGFYYSPETEKNYTLNYHLGLANNTILDALVDRENNLWLALDDGLSYIQNQSTNRYYFDYSGVLGAVYTAIEHNNTLYLGSNHGLFYFHENELQKVDGITSQVWYLKAVGNRLYCGHNNGTSIVEGSTSTLISEMTGGWELKAIPGQPSLYLQSSYTGFSVINGFQSTKVEHFIAPIKNFEWIDDHTILAADAYKGLYKIRFNNEYTAVTNTEHIDEHVFSSSFGIRLISIREAVFAYTDEWYRYDYVTGQLIADNTLQSLFSEPFHLTKSTTPESIWAIHQDQINQYNIQKKEKYSYPVYELENLLVSNNEHIIRLDSSQYLLTLNNGFVRFQNQPLIAERKQPIIYNVSSEEQRNETRLQKTLAYDAEPVSIQFATPEYSNTISYEYRLGENNEWNKTNLTTIIMEHLSSGKHLFQVRTVYSNNQTSAITSYPFRVKAHPLYQWWAYVLYVVVGLLAYLIYRNIQKAKLRKKQIELKKKLHQEHLHRVKEEQLQHEMQMAEVRNQQLENTIDIKKKELANSTLSLVKKNELLSKIKAQLIKAQNNHTNEPIKQVLRNINNSLSHQESWKLFETQFNEVHKEFLDQLKADFPNLTKKDLKLCAYLKMNLTSKEIAPLMDISTRGVETHRYRLRKKLDIETNENFQKYLETID